MGTRCLLAALLAGPFSAAILAASADAHAMGAVVTAPAGASAETEVRVVVSSTGTRTSRWASIRVHGDATTFAWVMPVRSDALVDLASDAWLEALAQATAPRVVPPDTSPPCGPGGVEVEDDLSHAATLAPDAVALVPDATALASTLGGWGMDLPADLAALAATDGADGGSDGGGGTTRAALLVLRYTNAPADAVTRTVRVVDSSPSVVPLAWTASGAGAIDVTAYAFARGFADVGSLAVVLDPNMVVWRDDGTSTYGSARDTLLASNPGAWLFETAGHAPLFDGETGVADQPGQLPVLTVPALAPTYYSLAAAYGDASDDETSCTASATAVSTSAAPVALACPAGALARGADASCTESENEDAGAGPASGTLAPATFRCGGIADDLALALSGLAPGDAWVTRARSVVPAGNYGVDAPVAADGAATAVGPAVACAGYEDACGASSSGAPPPPSGGGTAAGSSGGSGSGDGNDNGGGGTGADIGSAVGTAAGAAIDSSDGCGGDSSDGSGDACGGGSGSDGAGSDDSSGSGDCSGSTDTSGGGDCSAAPHDAGTRGRGRGHSPASRLLLVLTAMAAVARRGRRRLA